MLKQSAWVISANMGLGHQRATYPLRHMAHEDIQLFGENVTSSKREKRLWRVFRNSYEFLSKTRQFWIIGPGLYNLLERLQNISPYYPFRDQSRPSLQLKSLYSLISRGLGHGLSSMLSTKNLPVVTSFYAAAIAAEERTDLPVYCIICDSDINRAWVAENPKKSRIIYFAPCGHALTRLKQYGVPDERIFLTGFPLPQENIGGLDMPILKQDLAARLVRLDPIKRFRSIHGVEARHYLGSYWNPRDSDEPFTLSYTVGGAGAQAEIAGDVVHSLAPQILAGKVRLNLIAAHRNEVRQYFLKLIQKHGLTQSDNIKVIYNADKNLYFKEFNEALRTTDVLWTKPSELSFYCGLGIPIIIAPPIGPHEVFNRRWLRNLGAGLIQDDPKYCGEWLMEFLADGRLAQAAWDGFLYARKLGAYKIEEILETGNMERGYSPLKR